MLVIGLAFLYTLLFTIIIVRAESMLRLPPARKQLVLSLDLINAIFVYLFWPCLYFAHIIIEPFKTSFFIYRELFWIVRLKVIYFSIRYWWLTNKMSKIIHKYRDLQIFIFINNKQIKLQIIIDFP